MQVEWNDAYLMNHDVLDNEHKGLFRIVNKLFAMRDDTNRAAWACRESVKYFQGHTTDHFATEEVFMNERQYADRRHHLALHDAFRTTTLPALVEELERTDYSQEAIDHFVGVCAGWLLSHTITEDLAIVGRGSTTARKVLTGQQLQPIEQVFTDYMHDMFDMHGKVVSRHYGGERFGNGIYYHLVYSVKGSDKKEEAYFIFEESTLVHSVGLVLGTDAFDTSVMHATRYMAKQLMELIHENAGFAYECTLESEGLLGYNEFRDATADQQPQISLLIDSGSGYVAFQMVAPHDLTVNTTPKMEADTELKDVEKYLQNRTSRSNRPKILIVDDSLTIRENMRELLRDDYEVSLAHSGASAFRAMTLSTPDMVLLDYDMPLMDGKQVLHAMRAEEEFAGTPVVFLTGASDTGTVRKLLDLKPHGMLLKSTPVDDLKAKIDSLVSRVPARA